MFNLKTSEKFAVKLFVNKKELLYFIIFIFLILTSSIYFKYLEFQEFTKFKTTSQNLFIESQYIKKNYFVFKLKTENDFTFYSTSREKLRNLQGYTIQADIKIPKDFSFKDYVSGRYLSISNISLVSQKITRYKYLEYFQDIHKNPKIAEFYATLFLATPISKTLRDDLSRLGISHLAVLSGFHISFIIASILFFSVLLYKPIHHRFFPYRNFFRDTGIIASLLISVYLIFLGVPSSFLRAVAMFSIGFFLFDRNILKGLFETLFLAILILIAFMPHLIFSIGFWFSVSGVFYIFLYMKYTNFPLLIDIFLINIWVFIAMIPIVHLIFPNFYFLQLLSPIWTILFSIFYPLSALIHFLNLGNLFDEVLLQFLNLDFGIKYQFYTPIWFFVSYTILSLYFAVKKLK